MDKRCSLETLPKLRNISLRSATLAVCLALPASAVSAKGTFTNFDPPGAVSTDPTAISNGVIIGYYNDSSGNNHGFIRATDGTFTELASNTRAYSINTRGAVIGTNYTSNTNGFVIATDGKTTTFNVTGASSTVPYAINDSGAIAGIYVDPISFIDHGFVRSRNGTITTFDGPKALATQVWAINNVDQITGTYVDSSHNIHGFLRAKDGTFTVIDIRGAQQADPLSINTAGVIVGTYSDVVNHAFERMPDGTITTIDPPNAQAAGAYWISDGGKVVGTYEPEGSSSWYGFEYSIRTGKFVTLIDPDATWLTRPQSVSQNAAAGEYVGSDGAPHGFLYSR